MACVLAKIFSSQSLLSIFAKVFKVFPYNYLSELYWHSLYYCKSCCSCV